MKLTPRLQAIADLIPENKVVGDIGSDHGYLVTYLYETKKPMRLIASDINHGPVDNALRTFEENGLMGKIEVRLGGGFDPYQAGELNVAVIAGMGGILIRDIIAGAIEKANELDFMVLQPMTQQSVLRKWLVENGFNIFIEQTVQEGEKFYQIFCVKLGDCDVVDTLDLEIGLRQSRLKPPQLELSVWKAYLEYKIRKYETIKAQIGSKGSESSQELLAEVAEKLIKLRGILDHVC